MRCNCKVVSVFFLWIACSILFAHQLIPHDHHTDSSISGDITECLSHQDGSSSDHHGFPLHCHELNDLTFEKQLPVLTFNQDYPVFTIPSFEVSDQETLITTIFTIRFIQVEEPLLSSECSDYSLLRAPPTFA